MKTPSKPQRGGHSLAQGNALGKRPQNRKSPVRAKLHPFKRWTRRDLAPLLRAGAMLSNICYNLSQDGSIDPNHRYSMKEAQQAWDAALQKLPIWMKR